MRAWILSGALAAALVPVSAGSSEPIHVDIRSLFQEAFGGTDEYPIPAAWAGIWDIENEIFECGNSTPTMTTNELDTLCTGVTILEDDDEFELECAGSIADNMASIECTAEFPVFEGCTAAFTLSLSAIRNGDTYTGVTINSTDYVGDCGPVEDSCIRVETSGTRVAPEPASCVVPVERLRWGTLKSKYH